MTSLFIQLPIYQHIFSTCYIVAFTIALLVLLYEGHKRKYPILQWILIITFFQVLFIIGTKLFSLTRDEWNFISENHIIIPTSKKVLYGGLILGGIGLIIGKYWMKFKPNFLDVFAIALPLALAIQRVGCFFAGCCYGKPSNLPWAVQYPFNTLPHFHHFQDELIEQGSFFSLPVHPVQLYETLGILLILILVIKYHRKWKASGSSFLFSSSLYLLIRFIVEFFRDPQANAGVEMVGALNLIQVVIIIPLPALTFLIFYRENRWKPSSPGILTTPSLSSILIFFTLSAVLIWSLTGWFESMEIMVILFTFILAAIFTTLHILKNYELIQYRLFYMVLLIVPFFLMSQTLPKADNDSANIRKSKSIGIGFTTGNSDNENTYHSGEGCESISNSTKFKHKYTLAAAGVNFKKENLTRKSETNMGINIYGGDHAETNLTNNSKTSDVIIGINPYIKYDTRWLGIGGGIHVGNLIHIPDYISQTDPSIPKNGKKIHYIYPLTYFRVGPRDIFFLDLNTANQFPTAMPGYQYQMGIGTGFGLNNGTNLRFGITGQGTYITSYLPLIGGFIVEPLFHFSDNNFQFSFGIKYEFGQKTKN